MLNNVSIISSHPPCTDGNTLFSKVLLTDLYDQLGIRYQCLQFWKLIILIVVSDRISVTWVPL